MKYPLYRDYREAIRLPSGRPIGEFCLENVEAGRLDAEDLGIFMIGEKRIWKGWWGDGLWAANSS